MSTSIRGILRLTRWQEHVLFSGLLTIMGLNIAGAALQWTMITVLAANLLAVTFAFMVNDIEDALDDAHDPARAARNPVTSGEISRRAGWIASIVIGCVALALYALVNPQTFGSGTAAVLLGWLYSWRGVRLKALPVIDVISHALMLSSLLFLAGYFSVRPDAPGRAWLVALGVGLVSAYGQLYNQFRDYDADRAAGLCNTASVLGMQRTRVLMYGMLGLAAVCLVGTVLWGVWPVWFILAGIVAVPGVLLLLPRTDMRGTEAVDLSGRVQWGFMILANLLAVCWLIANSILT
ncbi:MAG: UbiA prenyltransferase family protein [Anaerolineae bacterium]|nr:UbiA prenyltransferase family protein [Anaerolineae bacterium]